MSGKLLIPLTVSVLLAGCATPPLVARAGDPAFAAGKTLALAPSAAAPGEKGPSDQAAALVVKRLAVGDTRLVDPAQADYLMQVTFAAPPRGVGVMGADDGDWLIDPKAGRRWGRRAPAYAVSLTAIEAKTGEAVFSATATERAHGEPAAAVERLVAAALPLP